MIDLIMPAIIFEVILRTVLIFIFTFIIIRIRGKRQLAQFSLFDVIIVIALGSAVGDVMVYPEDEVSLFRSVLSIGTLILLVHVIEYLLARSPPKIAELIHGKAITLVKNGKLIKENLKRSNITEDQLRSRLREKKIKYYSEARIVRLEPDGDISIVRKKSNKLKNNKKGS